MTVSYLYLQKAGISIPVSRFPIDVDSVEDYLAAYNAGLPEDSSRWVPKRKASFLSGRLAVQQLTRTLNIPDIIIGREESGNPVWPEGWIGSIAHAGKEAIATILRPEDRQNTSIHGVGLDIEDLKKIRSINDLGNMIALDSEIALLEQVGCARDAAILMIFSLKESVFKAVYPSYGQYFDFLDAALIEVDANGEWEVRLTKHLSEDFYEGFRLTVKAWIEEESVYSYAYW